MQKISFGPASKKNKKTTKERIFMKKKLKNFFKEAIKVGAIAGAIFIFLAMMPLCKGILARNYIVVTDIQTANQPITKCSNEKVLVEFRCNSKNFPKLLCTFIEHHKDLEFRFVETLRSENQSSPKGFVATFSQD